MIHRVVCALERIPNQYLYALVLICDLTFLTVTASFERFTIVAMLRSDTSIGVLALLLAANLLLLGLVVGGMFLNGLALHRLLSRAGGR